MSDLEKFFEDLEDEDEGEVDSFAAPRDRKEVFFPKGTLEQFDGYLDHEFKRMLSQAEQMLFHTEAVKDYLRDKGLGDDIDDGIWDSIGEELDRLILPKLIALIKDKEHWLGNEVEHYDPLH